MRGLDPSQRSIGRMEGLEAKHWARDPLYAAMVLFNDVVEIFDLYPDEGCAVDALARLTQAKKKRGYQ